MYAKKHRPMQKLTAICLSVSIAAASLLSTHVFASEQTPEPSGEYLTGQDLLNELRKLGLGQEFITEDPVPEVSAPESSETSGETSDAPVVDPSEPSIDPSEPSIDPSEPSVDPSEPSVDPSEPSVESSEPSVESTEPETDGGFEQQEVESTLSAFRAMPRDVVLNGNPDTEETPTDPIEETPEESSEQSTESSEPAKEPSDEVPVESSETSSEPVSEPSGEVPSEPSTDPVDPEVSVDPSKPVEEIPEESVPGTELPAREVLVTYVQALDAEQIVSLDDTNITEIEYVDLYSMLTEDQILMINDLIDSMRADNVTNAAPLFEEEQQPVSLFSMMSFLPSLFQNYGDDVNDNDELTKANGLNTYKEATYSDGTVTTTIEAYATGTVSTVNNPVDVVLVLDESGSMYTRPSWIFQYVTNEQKKDWIVVPSNELTDEMSGKAIICNTALGDPNGNFAFTIYKDSGTENWYFIDLVNKRWNIDPNQYTIYLQRRDALQIAATEFINSISASGGDNRVGVVGFSDSASIKCGLQNINTTDGKQTVINAINNLKASGATHADWGMQRAEDLLNSSDRQKVVILFTDGAPTSGTVFEKSVANGAIASSYNLKQKGTKVYTIGVMPEAKPFDSEGNFNTGDNINKFMHAVSSNYPDATSIDIEDLGNPVYQEDPTKSYYLSASSTDALDDIFANISHEIGNSDIQLDGEAEIKDYISPYFTVPNAETVEVYKVPCTGKTGDVYQFDESRREELSGAKIKTDNKGSYISVSDFDFAKNFVSDKPKPNTTDDYGYKLLITFTNTPKEGFLGGNWVPTNGNDSGVYDGNGDLVEHFDRPTVNVPISDYALQTTEQTIYLSNKADVSKSAQKPSFTGNDAWKDDFVTFSEPAWANPNNATPDDCVSNAQINMTITPEYDANKHPEGNYEAPTNAYQTAKDVSATTQIHVLKPELQFTDTKQNSGTSITAVLLKDENYVSATWKCEDGRTTPTDTTAVEPTITIQEVKTYQNDSWTIQTLPFNLTAETDFQVTKIKLNGGEKNYDLTTHFTVKDPTCEVGNYEHSENDRHFTIHLNNFDLTIKKIAADAGDGEQFRFTVTGSNGFSASFMLEAGEEIKLENLSAGNYTITEDTDWSWRYDSVSATVNGTSAQLNNGSFTQNFTATSSVVFTNSNRDNHWLSWEDTVNNIFKAFTGAAS